MLRIGSLCTGYGGLDLAVAAVLDAGLAWCAETDPYAAAVLAARWPAAPNLGDITAIDWDTVPPVDLITAGWPCQDISLAGQGAGLKGTRSGLWQHITRCLTQLRPPTWKTSPPCGPGAWPASWQILPAWGMTRNGQPYALAPPAPRTRGRGCSSFIWTTFCLRYPVSDHSPLPVGWS